MPLDLISRKLVKLVVWHWERLEIFLNLKWGCKDSTISKFVTNMQWVELTIKIIQKTNAEDNTDALLAEADYIFNNADLFIVDEEYAEAA